MMKWCIMLMGLMLLVLPVTAWGDYREEFEKGFLTKTWSGQQPEENFCIECHSSEKMKPEYLRITDEWKASWHAQNRIACHDCHGGDPKDPAMSMSPHRGFVGKPEPNEVPEFCGKCHIGILKNYLESGHGRAFRSSGNGPNCVTCHGSHNIQQANIEIISEQRCAKCHSYDRARAMKQALFLTEKKIEELSRDLLSLRNEGVYIDDDRMNLFSIQADFRALFHSVDVNLVKERTDEFSHKLAAVESRITATERELRFRRNFSAIILLFFVGMGSALYLLMKTPKE